MLAEVKWIAKTTFYTTFIQAAAEFRQAPDTMNYCFRQRFIRCLYTARRV